MVLMSNQASAQSLVDVAKAATAIKVVDNKGTIKYFQSSNGITQIVNTSPANVTTTTWQLGGTLTDDTYITTTNKVFSLKGLTLTTLPPAADGTTVGGYTLLVSNNDTGKVERLLATNLIQSGAAEDVLVDSKVKGTAYPVRFLTGLTADVNRISVFRNGIKLRQGTDWALNTGVLSITPTDDLPLFIGDVIGVQWIK